MHVETDGAIGQTYPAIEDTLAETANVVHISNARSAAPVNMRKYQANTAQIYGSEGHTGDRSYPGVIRLMANGLLNNLPIITSTFDLEKTDEAVQQAAERVDGKVLVEM